MTRPDSARTEPIAVLSDVHGNLTAFETVLADIAARGIHRVVNLGDVVGKGPRGSACVQLSRAHCEVTVRGNWDDRLPLGDHDEEQHWWWYHELTEDDRTWLLALPLSHDLVISGRRVRLLHASAESVHTRVNVDHTLAEFEGMFRSTELTGTGPEPTIVCYGDVHVANMESRRGRMLINVGSVGNSLDEPTASYVILDGVPDGALSDPFSVQFVRVPYDVEVEIAAATDLGMPELTPYAIELRTAVYRAWHDEPA